MQWKLNPSIVLTPRLRWDRRWLQHRAREEGRDFGEARRGTGAQGRARDADTGIRGMVGGEWRGQHGTSARRGPALGARDGPAVGGGAGKGHVHGHGNGLTREAAAARAGRGGRIPAGNVAVLTEG